VSAKPGSGVRNGIIGGALFGSDLLRFTRARLLNRCKMEETIKAFTLWLAVGTEAAAALIIGLATVEAVLSALLLFMPKADTRIAGAGPQAAKEQVRLKLGRWLAVALEFELGADILRTAVAPTWSEIGQLAAIAAIRTILNYFLQQEIDKAERRSSGGPTVGPG